MGKSFRVVIQATPVSPPKQKLLSKIDSDWGETKTNSSSVCSLTDLVLQSKP